MGGLSEVRLSELFEKYNVVCSYDIINEKEFDTLSLAATEIDLSVCAFIDDEKYLEGIADNVNMILTTRKIGQCLSEASYGICIVDNPRNTFFKLHNALSTDSQYVRAKCKTKIGDNCSISKLSYVAENNVIIGNNVVIEEFVVIRENTVIGDNCIVRAGVKLGSVDFEFKRENNEIFGVEHYGGIILKNNVEIQCNTVINRALYPWDNTEIGEFTKIDAAVVISHGVKIGKRNMVTGQAEIGGRTVIGDDCWIGLSSTIKNGLHIGDKSRINMGAVVTKDVEAGTAVTGNFAIEHSKFIRNMKNSVE